MKPADIDNSAIVERLNNNVLKDIVCKAENNIRCLTAEASK